MPFYHTLGSIPKKRHIVHEKPDGGVYQEQLMGNFGFTGPASLLYHIHPPTAVLHCDHMRAWNYEAEDHPLLRMRHLRTAPLHAGGSPVMGRVPLMFNRDCAILFSKPTDNDEFFYRNGSQDEYVYVASGEGVLETQFGDLPFGKDDQLIIPQGILHRYRFTSDDVQLLIVESNSYLRTPKRYRNEYGQIIEGAPFSERDFHAPTELKTHDEKGEFELRIRQRGGMTKVILDHHPLDVVGWDGFYFPWKFNFNDFEPITGTIHQPPPIHQILQSDAFVICNFAPRPFDFHPEAIPAPYYHSNVMSDEVLFYCSDEFMSRKGIEWGSLTLHPDGIPHGPHPGRYEGSIGQKYTNEKAVMVDTFRPLLVAKPGLEIEDKHYWQSWIGK